MKQVLLVLVLVLLVASATTAQESRQYEWFVDVQGAFLTEPEFWTDYFPWGFGLGFGVEYPVNPNWSLVGAVDLRMFPADKGSLEELYQDDFPSATSIDVSGGRAWGYSLSALGKGKLSSGEGATPYVKGGFGLTHITGDDAEVEYVVGGNTFTDDPGIEGETNLSITVGFGVEFPVSGGSRSFFVDLAYHLVMVDPDNVGIIPITVGLRL